MAEDRAEANPFIRKSFLCDIRACLKLLLDPIQILFLDRSALEFDGNRPMALAAPVLSEQQEIASLPPRGH